MQSQPAKTHIQKDSQGLQRLRYTCARIYAMAVQTLFPETKVTIGLTTDTGFYYDCDRKQAFTPKDLSKIAAEIWRIIQANLPVIRDIVKLEKIWIQFHYQGNFSNYKYSKKSRKKDNYPLLSWQSRCGKNVRYQRQFRILKMQANDFNRDLRIDIKETGLLLNLLAATKDFDEKPGFKSRLRPRLLMIFDRPTES